MKKIIEIKNLSKKYKTKIEEIEIFKNLDMEIYESDFISIQGKSGSGKSTFLNILGLLDFNYEGDYKFLNEKENLTIEEKRSLNIGFVFQFHHLLDEFTALENIMLAAKNDSNKKNRAIELLKIVGLEDRSNFYPNQLSGGEKQRVAIARSLINNPSIILADEPTGNLDEENSNKINELFKELNEKYKQTIVVVTHSKSLADSAKIKYSLENKGLKRIK